MAIRVLLVDHNEEYRKRLGAYIVKHCTGMSLTSSSGTHPGEERDGSAVKGGFYSNEAQTCDLILIDGEVSGIDDVPEDLRDKTVILDSTGTDGPLWVKHGIRHVYKYQRGTALIGCISELSTRSEEFLYHREGSAKIVCVTGFSGGSGRTSFALTYARMMSVTWKKRVLLVSLTTMSDLYEFFPPAPAGGSDLNVLLLNFLFEFSVDPAQFLMEDSHGVSSFIMPAGGMSDVRDLKEEEAVKWIHFLDEWHRFDVILFDCDGSEVEVNRAVWRHADRIFILHDASRHTGAAEKVWTRRMMDDCGAARIIHVRSNTGREAGSGDIFVDEVHEGTGYFQENCMEIPYDRASFFIRDGLPDISMIGPYAAAVAKLTEE